jgi:23S rRNA pseudouridine2605 synthase
VSERLQKLLAASGHGSRRQIEQWIRAGRISVDGRTATLGQRAAASADVRLDGRALQLTASAPSAASAASDAPIAAATLLREVLAYHKPAGEVTTRSDPQGRPTVFRRLPPPRTGRWIVVGRLDVNTTGLLLFTNDGELAHRLMHPSSRIEREYLVRLRGEPDAATLERLRSGVTLEDGPARFEQVEPVPPAATLVPAAAKPPPRGRTRAGHSSFRVLLREGRKREVRRLWRAVGFEVSRLMRVRYGAVELPRELMPGRWMLLDEARAAAL